MKKERRQELETLFIQDSDEDWREQLNPEEAALIARWDAQFEEGKRRLSQVPGENQDNQKQQKEISRLAANGLKRKQGVEALFF